MVGDDDAADAANKKMYRDSKPDSISAKYAKATKQQESLYKYCESHFSLNIDDVKFYIN